jgi:hypothetical protein
MLPSVDGLLRFVAEHRIERPTISGALIALADALRACRSSLIALERHGISKDKIRARDRFELP